MTVRVTGDPAPFLPKQPAWLLVHPTETLSPSDGAAVRRAEQDKKAAGLEEDGAVAHCPCRTLERRLG